MKKLLLAFSGLIWCNFLYPGIVEKTYYFGDPAIQVTGLYQTVRFSNTRLSGLPGEPMLPYHQVVLMLPPGEAAISIEITGDEETILPGTFMLFPQQHVQPVSKGPVDEFLRNKKIYRQKSTYPSSQAGHLLTQYLNGHAFALCTFTPLKFRPSSREVSYYRKVTVKVSTRPDAEAALALKNLSVSEKINARVKRFAQNPEMADQYTPRKSPTTVYQYLIIAPALFQNEFQPLINMYASKGITVEIATTESISSGGTGADLQEKIRNWIIGEYQAHGIEYVLLAGNSQLVPHRGFYCHVVSSSNFDDWDIPADLYYSGLDGNYNSDADSVYAEVNDDPDLLPDLAVARFPVNDTAELHSMIHKTIYYQIYPVLGELQKPLLAGEYLYGSYGNLLTLGGDYMDLLIDDHSDSGYFTHGIPSATNQISKLYDTLVPPNNTIWSWTKAMLIARINQGPSFIHHLGHAYIDIMLRMSLSDITNANFSQVDGIMHNYQLLYTQGCLCGAFDQSGCIASKALTIANFLAGGVFNSRYGWFNQGTSDGPSQHLEREFVSAIYTDTLPDRHLGEAHRISKVETAPWVTMPGEFEPGAQRWCDYCCNALGDPALEIHTVEPASFTTGTWTGAIDTDWNKPGNWNPAVVPDSFRDVQIPNVSNKPTITTVNTSFSHDLIIKPGGKVIINPGKSLIIRGSIIIEEENQTTTH